MIDLISVGDTVISIDVLKDFSSEQQAEYSEFAIQSGAVRSDHRTVKPGVLDFEICQTESPIDRGTPGFSDKPVELSFPKSEAKILSPVLLARAGLAKLGNAIGGAIGLGSSKKESLAFGPDSDEHRGNALIDLLQGLWVGEDLAEITYNGRVYPDMGLSYLKVEEKENEDGLTRARCTFKKVTIAVTAKKGALFDPDVLAHAASQALGKNTNEPKKGEKDSNKNNSIAFDVFG